MRRLDESLIALAQVVGCAIIVLLVLAFALGAWLF